MVGVGEDAAVTNADAAEVGNGSIVGKGAVDNETITSSYFKSFIWS